jgi:MOSC domain-containing protein YiiM
MRAVQEMDLVAGKGIQQDTRYFGRSSRSGGPSKRQVTLMEREQITEHAAVLGLKSIPPGLVRANIETEGIEWVPLSGRRVRIGSAELLIGSPRDPCEKMDRIAPGLRRLMDHAKQGVLAEVVVSGSIRVNDRIEVLP